MSDFERVEAAMICWLNASYEAGMRAVFWRELVAGLASETKDHYLIALVQAHLFRLNLLEHTALQQTSSSPEHCIGLWTSPWPRDGEVGYDCLILPAIHDVAIRDAAIRDVAIRDAAIRDAAKPQTPAAAAPGKPATRKPRPSRNAELVAFALQRVDVGETYGTIAARWNADHPGEQHDAESVRKAVDRAKEKPDKSGHVR